MTAKSLSPARLARQWLVLLMPPVAWAIAVR